MNPSPICAVFPQSHKAWDCRLLDQMRGEGDPPADDVVDQMLRASGGDPQQTARVLLRQLLGGGHYNALLGTPGTRHLLAFIEEHRTLPSWANRELIEHGQRLGRTHLVVGSVLLAAASLPECYLDAQGTPVLTSTGQLSEQPARRLRHTAHMVFSVCAPGSLYPGSEADPCVVPVAVRKALTVRLMHAMIRRFTIEGYQLPEAFYMSVEQELGLGPDSFGDHLEAPKPINQEDQAFVLLTFSYVVIRGLEQMGVCLTERDRDAYVHLWNVVGSVMGVREELMPDDFAESASLFHALKQRLAAPSADGQALMKAMMDWINRMVPRPLRVFNPAAEIITYFVGRKSASMLGIEQRGLGWIRHRLFTFPIDGFEALRPAKLQINPIALLVESLARPMVRRFMTEISSPRPPLPRPSPETPSPSEDMNDWPQYVIDSYGEVARP